MKNKTDFTIQRVIKYAAFTLAAIVAVVIFMAIFKIWFIYSTFGYFTYKISSVFGMDLMLSRVIAAMATVITLIIMPWIMVFLLFGKRKKEILLATAIIGSLCFLAVYFGTGNVFFDRTTGQPARYYVKTLEGFKFSMNADFDPKFGIKYKSIDGEVVKEYLFWEKFGKQRKLPEVKPGEYFDMLTGEPVVWYIEKFGVIYTFSLPGHDPATGRALLPMTQEVADRIELHKKKAADDAEAAKKRAEAERESEKRRILEELQSTSGASILDNKIIDLLKGGAAPEKEYMLLWYRKTKSAMEVVSAWNTVRAVYTYSSFFSSKSSEEEIYQMYVEKIIFLSPEYTIIGVCYNGRRYWSSDIHTNSFIIDAKIARHDPISVKVVADDPNNIPKISKGGVVRLLYIFNYIPPENVMQGEFHDPYGYAVAFRKKN